MSGNQIGSILLLILAIPLTAFAVHSIRTHSARQWLRDICIETIEKMRKEIKNE